MAEQLLPPAPGNARARPRNLLREHAQSKPARAVFGARWSAGSVIRVVCTAAGCALVLVVLGGGGNAHGRSSVAAYAPVRSSALVNHPRAVASPVAASERSAVQTVRDARERRGGGAAVTTTVPPCGVTVVMVDNRLEAGVKPKPKIWLNAAAVALNYAYAKERGYNFTLIKPTNGTMKAERYFMSWCKVAALERLVAERAGAACEWLLFLDTDAVVRQSDVRVPMFLDDLVAQDRDGTPMPNLSFVIPNENRGTSSETDLKDFLLLQSTSNSMWFKKEKPGKLWDLNTGMMFVKANEWSLAFLQQWKTRFGAKCHNRERFPYEQGCLNQMAHRLPRDRVLVAPGSAFGTPWGRFASHFWGGIAGRSGDGRGQATVAGEVDLLWRVNGRFLEKSRDALVQEALEHILEIPC